MEKLLLSCDWGTSSFRLRLMNTERGEVLHEVVSQDGIAAVYKRWNQQGCPDRYSFYLGVLSGAVSELSERSQLPLDNAVIVISGMASSSLGIKELRYAGLPFLLDAGNIYAEWIYVPAVMKNHILLVSGIRHPGDLMRGEETEMIGLAGTYGVSENPTVYILPGTHSKHITVVDNTITSFDTYMTGEVFELLCRDSVLSQSVARPGEAVADEGAKTAFLAGVQKSLENDLLNNLFSVRVNFLSGYFSLSNNYYYLSGLLIGSEVKNLKETTGTNYVLCGAGLLQKLYLLALKYIGVMDRTTVVEASTVSVAASLGHVQIFRQLISKPRGAL